MTKSQQKIEKRARLEYLMNMVTVSGMRIEAWGNGQAFADKSGLAMTVFYMDGYGYAYADPTHPLFQEARPKMLVTWLPNSYFN